MIYTDRPGDHPLLFEFLAKKTALPWSTDLRVIGTLKMTAQGVAPGAAVGYNWWVDEGVFMHVAFYDAHSLTKELLSEAFIYPFIKCDRRVVYVMAPITNEAVIRFSKRVGFEEILRSSTFVLLQMKRGDCRWINGKKRGTSCP